MRLYLSGVLEKMHSKGYDIEKHINLNECHILQSFVYAKDADAERYKDCKSFMMDSGAFTLMMSKSKAKNFDIVVYFKHCAEIEEPKTRRMTNKEFVLWLLEGIREGKLRQWRRVNSDTIESVPCGYTSEYEDLFVENKLIRENGGEWHEPLVEV